MQVKMFLNGIIFQYVAVLQNSLKFWTDVSQHEFRIGSTGSYKQQCAKYLQHCVVLCLKLHFCLIY